MIESCVDARARVWLRWGSYFQGFKRGQTMGCLMCRKLVGNCICFDDCFGNGILNVGRLYLGSMYFITIVLSCLNFCLCLDDAFRFLCFLFGLFTLGAWTSWFLMFGGFSFKGVIWIGTLES